MLVWGSFLTDFCGAFDPNAVKMRTSGLALWVALCLLHSLQEAQAQGARRPAGSAHHDGRRFNGKGQDGDTYVETRRYAMVVSLF